MPFLLLLPNLKKQSGKKLEEGLAVYKGTISTTREQPLSEGTPETKIIIKKELGKKK